jgi:SAM-dependent methyltransferase
MSGVRGIKDDLMKECPVCNKRDSHILFPHIPYPEKEVYFSMIRCRKCGLLFADPIPTEEFLNVIYQKLVHDQSYQKRYGERGIEWNIRNCFIPHLELIEKYRRPGLLLDLGCGEGIFLKVARERGWIPFGIEVGEPMVRKAQEVYGLANVKVGNLDFLDYQEESFDAVTFIHSLEHLTKPLKAVEGAFRVLKRGGLLYIAVPNFSYEAYRNMFLIPLNLRIKIIRRLSQIHPPTHIWIFSALPLKILLERVGFQLLEKVYGYAKSPYLQSRQTWLLRILFAPFMRLHGAGFYIHVLAQKP